MFREWGKGGAEGLLQASRRQMAPDARRKRARARRRELCASPEARARKGLRNRVSMPAPCTLATTTNRWRRSRSVSAAAPTRQAYRPVERAPAHAHKRCVTAAASGAPPSLLGQMHRLSRRRQTTIARHANDVWPQRQQYHVNLCAVLI